MSVEEARGENESEAPGRIIVVNDPKAIDMMDGHYYHAWLLTFLDFMRLAFLLIDYRLPWKRRLIGWVHG